MNQITIININIIREEEKS